MPRVPYIYEMGNEDRLGKKKKVTQKEKDFLELYLSKDTKTFKNHIECAKIVYGGSHKSARRMGNRIINKPRIRTILKDLLDDPYYNDNMDKGLRKLVKKPYSRQFIPACRLINEIRGDFAPVTTVNMNMTPEDRANELEEVARLLNVDPNVEQLAEGPDHDSTDKESVPSVLPVDRSEK